MALIVQMKTLLLCILWLSKTLSSGFSLVGNTYAANFKVPVISRNQNLKIEFTENWKANIKLEGFINSEGYVYYQYDQTQKTFTYETDTTIQYIMRKYLVNLYDIYYNETSDTAVISLQSKLTRVKQRIVLSNTKPRTTP